MYNMDKNLYENDFAFKADPKGFIHISFRLFRLLPRRTPLTLSKVMNFSRHLFGIRYPSYATDTKKGVSQRFARWQARDATHPSCVRAEPSWGHFLGKQHHPVLIHIHMVSGDPIHAGKPYRLADHPFAFLAAPQRTFAHSQHADVHPGQFRRIPHTAVDDEAGDAPFQGDGGQPVPEKGASLGSPAIHHQNGSGRNRLDHLPNQHIVFKDADGGYRSGESFLPSEGGEMVLAYSGLRRKLIAQIGGFE